MGRKEFAAGFIGPKISTRLRPAPVCQANLVGAQTSFGIIWRNVSLGRRAAAAPTGSYIGQLPGRAADEQNWPPLELLLVDDN